LSTPHLLTTDNEEAEIIVSDNIPFQTSQKFDSNGNPIFTFEYRDVGLTLRITPQINEGDSVVLDISQEVSSLSGLTAVASDLITNERKIQTKVLAQELAAFNIQVNAVAPCMVRTKFSEPFWSNTELHDQIVKTIPLGRIAEPADVAAPVLFLCSKASDFITGQTLMVDGGASVV